jgi:hypothetical protein
LLNIKAQEMATPTGMLAALYAEYDGLLDELEAVHESCEPSGAFALFRVGSCDSRGMTSVKRSPMCTKRAQNLILL